MLKVRFTVDDVAVTARLTQVDTVVFAAIAERVAVYTAQLETYVETQKLQGQVLRHITGKLSASIEHDFPVSTDTKIQGRVFSNDTVAYAAIHEFGGVIPAHFVFPDTAKALHFFIGGREVFAAYAEIPDVTMPERSFLRSSLRENAERFERGIMKAALMAAASNTDAPILED